MDQPPHPRRSDLRDEGPDTFSPDRRIGRTPRAVARYVLDGTGEDLKRLLAISDLTAEFARIALHRVGVQEGWNAIHYLDASASSGVTNVQYELSGNGLTDRS